MNIEKFKRLNKDKKIHYLFEILFPITETEKDREALEIFLFWSKDEELVDFYKASLNPDRIAWYINKKRKNIKESANELNQINKLFSLAKIEVLESQEKESVDKTILDI